MSYFEPAVLTPPNQQRAAGTMKLFADFIKEEPNIIENVTYVNPEKIERTLVLIKPDNWRFPSSKPGAIIDMFSRTGLRIISCKLVQMSVAEAMEFYKPVEESLRQKLAPDAGKQAKEFLESKFNFKLSKELTDGLIRTFGMEYAEEQFNRIVEFMSGYRSDCSPKDDWDQPGCVKSMALVYEGENAVQKIRTVLGNSTIRNSNVPFFLLKVKDSKKVEEKLKKIGISVIREIHFRGLEEDTLRIKIGKSWENSFLIESIDKKMLR